MSMFNNSRNHIKRNDRPVSLVEWFFLGITIVICFLFFNQFYDLSITVQQSLSLYGAIHEGKFFHYYEYVYNLAHQSAYYAPGIAVDLNVASYSFFLYGLIALWNLPIKIISKFIFFPPLSVYLFWSKLLILVFLVLSVLMIYKIGRQLGLMKNRSKWMSFFFMSSPITLFTVVVFGQFDIICVFLALCGIYFFYKKKYYKFVIMFGLAITFKAYMLFILIPLILLIEKRVLHIIKYLLISSWCMILERLLFLNDPYCSLSKNYIHDTYGFMKRIYNYGVNLQVGPVFLLGIVMVFVCVFAYRQKKDPLIVTPYSYYLSFLVNAALILSIHWHPQWMIILVPFLVINTFMFSEFKLSVYLQYFMFAFFLIETYMVFYKNVDQAMINNGILPLLTGKYLSPDSVTYASLLDKLKLPVSVYNTLLIGCGLSFAYLFKPAPSLPAGNDQPESDFDHRLIWGNLGLIYIYIIPTLIIYFLKAV